MIGDRSFTSLDLLTGYWNIKLGIRVQEMTTLCCKLGSFCFVVISFGVKNGVPCFRRMAAVLFYDLPFVIVYIENIVIKSRSWEEHIEEVGIVLGCLREAELKPQVKECEFGRAEIAMLGNIVSGETVRTDPIK